MTNAPLAPRRTFLQRLTAGTAFMAVGGWKTAGALSHPSPRRAAGTSKMDDAWLERIRGEHRQVFDVVEPNRGFGAVYALNYIDSFHQLHPDADVTAVISYRHFAMPLMLSDAAWEAYNIGSLINVTDPDTQAPAKRNIFRGNVMMRPGLTYEQMMAEHGVIMTACNMALTVLSGMAAQNAGKTAEQAKQEWEAALLPGVVLVPSGVYAVNRAQERECTYCYAG